MPSLPTVPSFRLDGKRALITGAANGIGLAAATALAQAGAAVTICDKQKEAAEDAAAAIRERGSKADVLVLDVTDVEAVRAAIAKRPHDHILVNNAGTNKPQPFTEVDIDIYDSVIALNLRAAFFVAQAVAKKMIEGKEGGSIIHTSSQMGHVAMQTRAVYCVSKFGIEGMNKAMALDLAPYGIRSNTLAPTFVETPLTKKMFENKPFLDLVMGNIKLGRLGKVEDLMGAIVFLASDASAMMTGSSLVIDGGWTAA
jgi:NAD(P)-dependent dehydrogenase (short-subunit alcohol dehydrogenase family)